jgi:UDP-N-acetylmuramate dehydrogenase
MKATQDGSETLLSPYTTFRIGGHCRRIVECRKPDELVRVMDRIIAANDPYLLIGGGSNLLVSDSGIDAVVVRYLSESPEMFRDGHEVVVSGSTLLDDLVALSVEQGLDGLVACSGIPGTVGGAIAGNAGAFGEQIADRLVSVALLDCGGRRRDADPADLGFAYRRSNLQVSGEIVVEARLRLEPAERERLALRRREILALRASRHPDWRTTPTAGSFFKNIEPTSKAERRQAAGWFLEQAGAKDFKVGGARVFEKHANIVVAEPGCRAADVHRLAQLMAEAVKKKFGFDLEPEVRRIGHFV